MLCVCVCDFAHSPYSDHPWRGVIEGILPVLLPIVAV